MDGIKFYREIFHSLPPIDDLQRGKWFSDLTQEQRDEYVKMIYANTKKVLGYGVLVPFTESHNKNTERLAGSLLGVSLKYKANPKPHYVIIGECFLNKEYYKLYKDKELPAVSIEIAEDANLEAYGGPSRIGEYIMAVAMMGATPAAMPSLEVINDVQPQPYAVFMRLSGVKKYNYKEFGSMKMKEKLISALMDAINSVFTETDKEPKDDEDMVPLEGMEMEAEAYMCGDKKKKKYEEEPKKEEEEKEEVVEDEEEKKKKALMKENYEAEKSESDSKIADLQKQLDELKNENIEKDFQLLAHEGKVNPEQKDHFAVIAKKQGIKFAREVYGAMPTKVPQGEIIKNSNKTPRDKRLYQTYKNMGLNEDQITATFERISNRQSQAN